MDRPIIAQLQPQIDAFPDTIRKAKKLAGKTNQEIADATGVPVAHLAKYMSGNLAIPNLYYAAAICRYLDVSMDQAFDIRCASECDSDELRNLENRITIERMTNQHLAEALRSRKMIIATLLGICVLLIASFGFGVVYDAVRPEDGFIQGSHIAGISILLITVIVVAIAITVSIMAITFKNTKE